MTTLIRNVWQSLRGPEAAHVEVAAPAEVRPRVPTGGYDVQIAPNDTLLAYFQTNPGVVEIDKLKLESPALAAMQAADVKLVVPLVSQGELIGLINLGSRLSEQEYSADDRRLLDQLATQAAPALRVAQLVRQQQAEARQRERLEHELRVARFIQETLLPRNLPDLDGWGVGAHWQPAQAVGGDFYDFLELPDGRLAIIVGDVTDKGVPAALVMASTRTIVRAAAERLVSPGEVLARANNLLCPDIPPKMFVTCLYAVLEPHSGRLEFANAGHNLPYRRTRSGIEELWATGMPLGLMPDMHYEEATVALEPGDTLLVYSDGLIEAHNPRRDMYGFPRLRGLMASHPGGSTLIDALVDDLAAFTGDGWEQEDDVTFVTLERSGVTAARRPAPSEAWRVVADFEVASEPGNERLAMEQVAAAVQPFDLPASRLERLKTAVAEATLNAMEHGHHYQADLPVSVRVRASAAALTVTITDQGGGTRIPDPETPDLEAKLEGRQRPRGWGLFLIENMVDDLRVTVDDSHHTVDLVMYQNEGDRDGNYDA
jgi:serine phosphatase RsbU (regulator of sigma subunit)/anti-sigma regulatory factor (Ser/Thr protein kinase)